MKINDRNLIGSADPESKEDYTVELWKMHSQFQEKIIYYLVGLAVALIAYSIHATRTEILKPNFVFLWIAILFWSITVYVGIDSQRRATKYITLNYLREITKLGRNVDIGKDKERIRTEIESINEVMIYYGGRRSVDIKRLIYSFYTGIIFFLIWYFLNLIGNHLLTNIPNLGPK